MVTKINDLTFKKDEKYIGKHIYLSETGTLYFTEEFAKYLTNGKCSKYRYCSTEYHIVYNYSYKCTLYTVKFNGLSDEKFNYYLGGSSGSHGFGGLQEYEKYKLGIRTVRLANKLVFELYLKSPLSRLEKLIKIKNNINNVI